MPIQRPDPDEPASSLMKKCPTCGRPFCTDKQIRIHHTQTHGEHLPNRTCKECGGEFYDSDSGRVRCDDCSYSNVRSK